MLSLNIEHHHKSFETNAENIELLNLNIWQTSLRFYPLLLLHVKDDKSSSLSKYGQSERIKTKLLINYDLLTVHTEAYNLLK